MMKFFKYILLTILFFMIAVVLTIFSRLAYNYLTQNVHTVIPKKIYRTAQLDENGLSKYTQKFHWKTIINLRGAWPSNHWYDVESHFAKIHHLHYYPLPFSAYHVPKKALLQKLVHVLLTAPKPLVFHCEGGADRTGMAAAISIILFTPHPTRHQIEREASWHYNAISSHTVGYQVMRNYFAWLSLYHYHSSKTRFLQWVKLPEEMRAYQGWFVV